ncbi:VOC family protein [Mucilaginibacter antarcticus]|uniref:VOC family protein n=1 Tax=Mucilaginibacter antarcticus TaxID=1855725 RepID=A0ABW5XSA8_9SPHI
MATINPYLNLPGNTEEAFNFYKSVFGGEFSVVSRFKDTEHGVNMPAEDQDKVMHISLPIGQNVLMGTDALESAGHFVTIGDNISISISTDSVDETNQLFDALSAGGKVEVPVQKMFWGAWFGMFTDKFGIKWMINYDEK